MCQPGRPGPHGDSNDGSPGFAPFHRREVGGVPLSFVHFGPRAGQHLFQAASAQLAVVGVFRAVEIDVAVERVGVALLDQRGDDLVHLADVFGRLRKAIDGIDAHRLEIVEIIPLDFLGDGGHRRVQFLGPVDDLVVHVGDVDHPRHLVTAVHEIPLDRVEDDRPDHVADVRRLVHRRPAEVHLHLAGLDRLKVFLLPGQRVVNSQRHGLFREKSRESRDKSREPEFPSRVCRRFGRRT